MINLSEHGLHRSINDILQLPTDIQQEKDKLLQKVFVGTLEEIKEVLIQRQLDPEDLHTAVTLGSRGGGFVMTPSMYTYVNSGIWPGELSHSVVEHEVMEGAYLNYPDKAKALIGELGLSIAMDNPPFPHFVGVVYQMFDANQREHYRKCLIDKC